MNDTQILEWLGNQVDSPDLSEDDLKNGLCLLQVLNTNSASLIYFAFKCGFDLVYDKRGMGMPEYFFTKLW
jgi:hypothetical protein